jgi:hypothetical protein
VVHEVGADGAVPIGHERDFQLGADAVGARDQDGLFPRRGVELEQPAEGTNVGQHTRCERGLCQLLDAADGFVTRIDVDT